MTALAIPFLLLIITHTLHGQSRGEVQVTAQVLPLVPSREAALATATGLGVPQTDYLFRITRLHRPATVRASDIKRDEVIIVVEFLAN